MVAGDTSHQLRQGDIATAIATACGFTTGLPIGRPGNPGSGDDWYTVDWMDTDQAQQALSFQRHPWPDMLAEIHDRIGWKRTPARLLAPAVRPLLRRWVARQDSCPGRYADVWKAVRTRFGDPFVGVA
jgi:hypothetical protein